MYVTRAGRGSDSVRGYLLLNARVMYVFESMQAAQAAKAKICRDVYFSFYQLCGYVSILARNSIYQFICKFCSLKNIVIK